jgi:hypothetical protein
MLHLQASPPPFVWTSQQKWNRQYFIRIQMSLFRCLFILRPFFSSLHGFTLLSYYHYDI